ncbi:MAG: hypothetical protein WCJ33_06720 [Pseudomonadota bacterium]
MEKEKNESWNICCSKSSSQFIKFTITAIVCFSVMIFSMLMISNNPEKDNSIYFSLISSILSLYIPSPALHSDTVPQIEHSKQYDKKVNEKDNEMV